MVIIFMFIIFAALAALVVVALLGRRQLDIDWVSAGPDAEIGSPPTEDLLAAGAGTVLSTPWNLRFLGPDGLIMRRYGHHLERFRQPGPVPFDAEMSAVFATEGEDPMSDPWSDVDGLDDDAVDPAGPPACIHISVTGTHPWAPARVFIAELKAEGDDITVERPDLVVLRDGDRQPVTVAPAAGSRGDLVVTAPPDLLPRTLEVLVRSLLSRAFRIDATDGRDIHLVDDGGCQVRLTVTKLATPA